MEPLRIKMHAHRDGTYSLSGLDPMAVNTLVLAVRGLCNSMAKDGENDTAIRDAGKFTSVHVHIPLATATKSII